MKLIKFIPGDIIKDLVSSNNFLVTSIHLSSIDTEVWYYVIKLDDPIDKSDPWWNCDITTKMNASFIRTCTLVHRLYKEFYDDYFCHDHRCKMCDLIGCGDCWWKNKKPTSFLPGDLVYQKRNKTKLKVQSVSLVLDFDTFSLGLNEEFLQGSSYHLQTVTDVINKMGLYLTSILTETKLKLKADLKYSLRSDKSLKTTVTVGIDEIVLYKRNSAVLLPEHKKSICSELCIYSGGEECYDCQLYKEEV